MAIKKEYKLELISITSYSGPFLGFYEDFKVAIRGLKTKHLIFVVETGDHELILSQSFLNFIKFSQNYKLVRIFGTIIYLYIY